MNSLKDRRTNTQPCLWMASHFLLTLGTVSPAMAAPASSAASATFWNVLIVLIVFVATISSAVLNVAAIRQWDRNWGLVSGLPILGLVLWSAIILTSKIIDPGTHMLWTLEIFAWAMINMIYMVTAMTAKRIFAKRDGEDPSSS